MMPVPQFLFALSLGFGGVIWAVQASHAQSAPPCAPRATVVEALSERYGESRQSIGMSADNMVVEVYASRETGSWSLVITRPDGLSCLAVTGNGFEVLAEAAQKGDPA
ncbi:hypothetical protein [Neogemmobacter tilapiae]|jgi:hypothetical protein|uniref:Uncharacterized protein n=1 Tax=Neogemmobacter tilapiae TaxID=875041 RepID=A0A918WK00_9RHOB|nr:hypothetical protein [Gemmobacter tilapiae]GHC52838.1 hypothetical protein GCM10007315_14270 [Gemmobacter tilapiae]